MKIHPRLRRVALRVLPFVIVAAGSFWIGSWWQQRRGGDRTANRGAEGLPAPTTNGTTTGRPGPAIASQSIRAEFNPQSALLLGANELVRYHQKLFQDVARAAHGRLSIIGFVSDENEMEIGQQLLVEAELPTTAVRFVKHPLNSMWLRDFGPIFSRWSDGRVEVIDAIYRDAQENRMEDDAFAGYIARVLGLKSRQMPLVIEGGNLISNGDGLMVTTSRVINRAQNSHLTREKIGAMLGDYLGCRLWVYLRELDGEPTGHVDFCVTFLRRSIAVVGQYDPAYDPTNAAILDAMAATLRDQPTSMGPVKVHRIYMPPRTAEGDWRSYCNVLMLNGIMLVPSYSDVDPAKEQEVLATYSRLAPALQPVLVNCDSLVKKRGVLHCIGITVPGYVNVQPLLDETM